jgi:hypothetical protein
MAARLRRTLALGLFGKGVEGVDVEMVEVGLTPLPPLDELPPEYREFIEHVQKVHHKQMNELAIAIGEYDLGMDDREEGWSG